MHFDEMIDPIWEEFMRQTLRFNGLSYFSDDFKAAFYWAIKNSVEKLDQESFIDRLALTHGKDSYVDHMKKATALRVGEALFDRIDLRKETIVDSPMGKKIKQEIFVVKIGQPESDSLEGADER